MKNSFTNYLKIYFSKRPMFLVLIRAKELTLFEENLELTGRVLDFGCGDGFFIQTLIGQNKTKRAADLKLTGLDIDQDKLREAKDKRIYQKLVRYDGKKLPFSNDYFEMVISNCVLEHVSDLSLVLKEINRVLKPGGQFVTTVMTNKWEEYLAGAKIFGQAYKKWMRKIQKHFNLLTANEWQKAFSKAQFKVIKQIGYLDEKASMLIDCFHYLSFYSLLCYKLTGRWVIWPSLFSKLAIFSYFEKVFGKDIAIDQSAAVFLKMKK